MVKVEKPSNAEKITSRSKNREVIFCVILGVVDKHSTMRWSASYQPFNSKLFNYSVFFFRRVLNISTISFSLRNPKSTKAEETNFLMSW